MTTTIRKSILVLVLVQLLSGCMAVAPRPEQLPGESEDPARAEEAAAAEAERAGNEQAATGHRERANEKRRESFENDCNLVSILFGVLIDKSACGFRVIKEEKPRRYM